MVSSSSRIPVGAPPHGGRIARRLPMGAEPQPGGGVHFRVWAPDRARVEVMVEGGSAVPLAPEPGGWFGGLAPMLKPGARYRYQLDGEGPFPDPASRFQPDGPHGPSEIIDPATFRWTDAAWPGVRLSSQVIYELHVGTFTTAGTWAAAARELPALAELGVTLLEVMPLAEFPGRFGWGYDGVDLFAPSRLYGRPDDVRVFIDRAHALGLGVILDVVYNHFGPDGNYLTQFAGAYFTERHATPWGPALNYDSPARGPVRELVLANAGYWVDEFHVDGLRLDAVHTIYDDSAEHILTAVARRVRERAGTKGTLVFAEDEQQRTSLARPVTEGGLGLDGIWNDDFHHSARVAATGKREGYYRSYTGAATELLAALRGPFAAPDVLEPAQLVTYLQNHDQIAHSGRGLRLPALTSPGRWRSLTTLWLLTPGTPLFFMGQEFAASSPFLFFADHAPELAERVRWGRAELLAQFESVADAAMRGQLADPGSVETFATCRLNQSERELNPEAVALHRDLLALRRSDPRFAAQRPTGTALGASALALRFAGGAEADRLLLVNLGADLPLDGSPDPLLTPPPGAEWRLVWSSEDPGYGGGGTPAAAGAGRLIPAESALVLAAAPRP